MNHFQTHGWVRIPGAFSPQEAAAMRDVVWRALAAVSIQRDDPTTWRTERPDHLQHLKSDPVFRAVGSNLTLAAIDEALGGQPWRRPSDWGAFFLVFPTGRPWNVPADGWHVDAGYTGPLSPPKGVKVHAIFGDVAPRAGGMKSSAARIGWSIGGSSIIHRGRGPEEPSSGHRSIAIRTCGISAPPARPLPASSGSTSALRRSTESRCRCWKIPRRRATSS